VGVSHGARLVRLGIIAFCSVGALLVGLVRLVCGPAAETMAAVVVDGRIQRQAFFRASPAALASVGWDAGGRGEGRGSRYAGCGPFLDLRAG